MCPEETEIAFARIQQVMPKQAIKATQINELVNFCNDLSINLPEMISDEVTKQTEEIQDEEIKKIIVEELDLSDIYNRLNNLETIVNNLPNDMINEAKRVLSTFTFTLTATQQP